MANSKGRSKSFWTTKSTNKSVAELNDPFNTSTTTSTKSFWNKEQKWQLWASLEKSKQCRIEKQAANKIMHHDDSFYYKKSLSMDNFKSFCKWVEVSE